MAPNRNKQGCRTRFGLPRILYLAPEFFSSFPRILLVHLCAFSSLSNTIPIHCRATETAFPHPHVYTVACPPHKCRPRWRHGSDLRLLVSAAANARSRYAAHYLLAQILCVAEARRVRSATHRGWTLRSHAPNVSTRVTNVILTAMAIDESMSSPPLFSFPFFFPFLCLFSACLAAIVSRQGLMVFQSWFEAANRVSASSHSEAGVNGRAERRPNVSLCECAAINPFRGRPARVAVYRVSFAFHHIPPVLSGCLQTKQICVRCPGNGENAVIRINPPHRKPIKPASTEP
jgi:hypothetical protein